MMAADNELLDGVQLGAGLRNLRLDEAKTADWKQVGLWGAGTAAGALAGGMLGDVAADSAFSLAPDTLNHGYTELAGQALGAGAGGNLGGFAATALLNQKRQGQLTVRNLPAIAAGLPVDHLKPQQG